MSLTLIGTGESGEFTRRLQQSMNCSYRVYTKYVEASQCHCRSALVLYRTYTVTRLLFAVLCCTSQL